MIYIMEHPQHEAFEFATAAARRFPDLLLGAPHSLCAGRKRRCIVIYCSFGKFRPIGIRRHGQYRKIPFRVMSFSRKRPW
jgi:hypothetical protein